MQAISVKVRTGWCSGERGHDTGGRLIEKINREDNLHLVEFVRAWCTAIIGQNKRIIIIFPGLASPSKGISPTGSCQVMPRFVLSLRLKSAATKNVFRFLSIPKRGLPVRNERNEWLLRHPGWKMEKRVILMEEVDQLSVKRVIE